MHGSENKTKAPELKDMLWKCTGRLRLGSETIPTWTRSGKTVVDVGMGRDGWRWYGPLAVQGYGPLAAKGVWATGCPGVWATGCPRGMGHETWRAHVRENNISDTRPYITPVSVQVYMSPMEGVFHSM